MAVVAVPVDTTYRFRLVYPIDDPPTLDSQPPIQPTRMEIHVDAGGIRHVAVYGRLVYKSGGLGTARWVDVGPDRDTPAPDYVNEALASIGLTWPPRPEQATP